MADDGRKQMEQLLTIVVDQVSYKASPGETVTFGRGESSTIRIGVDDPSMHRRAGSLQWVDDRWELHNDGSRAALEIQVDGGFEARISAGADPLILPAGAYGTVYIDTPSATSFGFATPPTPGRANDEVDEDVGSTTAGPRDLLGLSRAEVRMLVALCEPRLRNPRLDATAVPSAAEVCQRLDITPKRAEDLIDGLATKVSMHLAGVIGSNQGRAVNRRQRIAAFAFRIRCVTVSDLRLLDDS